jgi:hypothetical protein
MKKLRLNPATRFFWIDYVFLAFVVIGFECMPIWIAIPCVLITIIMGFIRLRAGFKEYFAQRNGLGK